MATNTTKRPQPKKMVIQQDAKKGRKYDKLPDRVRKELRRTIAMVLYESVLEQDNMKILFYGEGDSISYLDVFLRGMGIFHSMFEANTDNSGSRKVKSLYARSSKDFILGGNINRDVMERVQLSKTEIVTGRYLRSCATEGGCEARKSLPFLLKYLDKETGKPLRSGDEVEDVITKWLDDYYVYCESGNVTSPEKAVVNEDPSSSDDDEDRSGVNDGPATTTTPEIEDEGAPSTPKKVSNTNGDVVITIPHRQSDWFFPGFMFVLLFGPFAENMAASRTMNFFLNKDPAIASSSEKKAYGRSKMREVKKEEILQPNFESTNKRRAISVNDEIRMANLECKQASLRLQNARVTMQSFESILLAKKMEMDGIRSLMDAASQMAQVTKDWSTWKRLFDQHEACQQEMRALNTKHEKNRTKLEEVEIPSLALLKRRPILDDGCPVKEIVTEERSSGASQLSSPTTKSPTTKK